jgi:phosphomannomutase
LEQICTLGSFLDIITEKKGLNMKVEPSIFKAYDIRGIYGQTLDEEVARAVGKAFSKVVPTDKVIVGRDARISSPTLHDALVDGLTSVGITVIDAGMVSTDMYYFACATRVLPGIMVTASHNPKEYNGFKMVRKIPYLLSGDEGIQDIRKVIEADDFPPLAQTPAPVEEINIMDEFIAKIVSLVDITKFKPMKIIADTANGMVGPSLTELFKQIPQINLIEMYFEPDGNFPNHTGDPIQEEYHAALKKRVIEENADMGLAWDPDGDRIFCIDKKGRYITGDFLTAILSYYFLQKNPGAAIIYDIRASQAVADTITKYGGRPLYNKVGHAFIKKRMGDENAVFAGEISGHYYFRDFYNCDSGVVLMVYLLELLSHSELPLEIVHDQYLDTYFISGEINSKVPDVKAVLATLEEKYGSQASEVIKVDGITCEMGDWRFNVRGSNTEPLIRLNLESKTREMMEQKRDEVLAVIRA